MDVVGAEEPLVAVEADEQLRREVAGKRPSMRALSTSSPA